VLVAVHFVARNPFCFLHAALVQAEISLILFELKCILLFSEILFIFELHLFIIHSIPKGRLIQSWNQRFVELQQKSFKFTTIFKKYSDSTS
jgi:hypothetical protein